MPDPKQMSGIPRPVDDLPSGSLSVRLIRGDLANNITNHPVELHIGSKVQTANTDENGRAQFDNLPAGRTLKAVAVVDGERLESQEFPAPARGGIRLMLVATDTTKAPATEPGAPPVSGEVALGSQTRIVIEPGDETLQIYYLLDIVNSARAPVNPVTPFSFEMPAGAGGATILEGSSPLASANGSRVSVKGPIPPGRTFVQVACELRAPTGTVQVTQRFPAALEQLGIIVKKAGAMRLTSPQISEQREFTAQADLLIAATGNGVPAGQPIVLTLDDLPHHSAAPRRTALSLAVGIAMVGVWASRRRDDPGARDAERRRLIARREKLLTDLVRLENDHRKGRVDGGRYAARREELIAALEHVYGALDGPDDHAGLAACESANARTKFSIRRRPTAWLFSGWNCTPRTLPRPTMAGKRTP